MPDFPVTRPLALTRLTRAQARLQQRLAWQPPWLTLTLENETLKLRLAPTSEAPSHTTPPGLWLRGAEAHLWLELDPDLFDAWLRPWIGDLALDQLPPALSAAARQAALSPLLDALESLMAIRFELTDQGMDRDSGHPLTDSALGLWRTDAPTDEPVVRLRLNAAANAQLANALEQSPPVSPSDTDRWPTLPLILTPRLGTSRLTVRQWRTLDIGDLLLLARRSDPSAISILLCQRRRVVAVAHLNSSQIIIDRWVTSMSEPLTADPDSIPSAFDPDDLEIRIDFDLGSLQVPLRELRAIQPGYCFEFAGLDRPRIRLIVGDRLIGHGELVMVEDHLGVRVAELFQPPSAA